MQSWCHSPVAENSGNPFRAFHEASYRASRQTQRVVYSTVE